VNEPSSAATTHQSKTRTRSVLDLVALARLQIRQAIGDSRYLILGVALPLAIYFAYTVTGIGRPTAQSTQGIAWPSWLMVSMASFAAMSAATLIGAARPSSLRAARAGTGTTVLVKTASAMVLAVPPVMLLGLAGAFAGVRLPVGEWVALVTLLWLGTLPFVALGLLLGPMLDADTEGVVLLVVLVVLAVLGGLFQPIQTFPTALATVARVVPSYYLADLGWTMVARGKVDPVDVVVLTGYLLGIGAVVVWRNWSEDRRVGV
jgi:ABC-2 type transport system permease protein